MDSWDYLEMLFMCSQDEREGVLYLGIAGDEIPAGAFNNDAVGLNLVAVNGPGNVFLYATDARAAVRPSITTLLMGLDQMMCSQ